MTVKPKVIWLCEDTGVSYRCVDTERGLIFEAGDGADATGQRRWREVENGDGRWREIAYRLAGSVAGWPKEAGAFSSEPDGISPFDRCAHCREQYCNALDELGDPVHSSCLLPPGRNRTR